LSYSEPVLPPTLSLGRKPWDRGRLARKVLPGGILAGETPAIPDFRIEQSAVEE
jgi:hypothetical protein